MAICSLGLSDPSQTVRRYLSISLRVAIATSALVYLHLSNKLDLSVITFLLKRPQVVVPVLLLLLAVAFLGASRLRFLLGGSNAPVRFRSVLRLTLIGNFFNFSVPGGVGGDVVKTYYFVKQEGLASSAAISSVVVDRFVGISVLVAIGLASLFFSRLGQLLQQGAFRISWPTLVIVFFVGIPLLVWALAYSKRGARTQLFARLPGHWGKRFAEIRDALLDFRHAKAALLLALPHSLGIHLCVIAAFGVLGQALDITQLRWFHYTTLVPLGMLTVALSVAPAGIGVTHLAFYTLFSLVGSQRGADLFSIYLVCQLLAALPGLFFYLMLSPYRASNRSAVS